MKFKNKPGLKNKNKSRLKVNKTSRWRPLAFVVSFVVAMNRVDVVELVVNLDVDLVDVDLAVSLCDGPRSVLFSFGLVAPTCFYSLGARLVFEFLA